MNIKKLLNEEVRSVLGDDSLEAIQTAFENKVTLSVESALEMQDNEYAIKLESLMERIDGSYGVKLKRVLEAVDADRSKKLVTIVKRYEQEISENAKIFKNTLYDDISEYLDVVVLEDVLPKKEISEAVRNKSAMNVLENLRQVLAVDSVMMKESVQDAIIDGKSKIDNLQSKNEKLVRESKKQTNLIESFEKKAFLAESCGDFDKSKSDYVTKVLGDKSVKYVKENFEFVSNLFDKRDKEAEKALKNEAFNNRETVIDSLQSEIIEENVVNTTSDTIDPEMSQYINVMNRNKF